MTQDPFWIASRGRAGRSPTIAGLAGEGLQPRVVVHESEAAVYANAYPRATIVPHNLEGIGRIRGHILDIARRFGEPALWMLDDDIANPVWRNDGIYEPMAWREWLLAMRGDIAQWPLVALASPKPRQFAFREPHRVFNRRVGQVVWVHLAGPWRYWPRLHEDTDLMLQVLYDHRQTLAWGTFAYTTIAQGKNPGGCADDYAAGKGISGAVALVEKWNALVPDLVSIKTRPDGQVVTRIKWRALGV